MSKARVSAGNPAKPFVQLSLSLQRAVTWGSGLEGQLLTLADATFSDKDQREAFKSMLKRVVRDAYRDHNRAIDYQINRFTDTFEGDEIEYTVNEYPGDNSDCRKTNNVIHEPDLFRKSKSYI